MEEERMKKAKGKRGGARPGAGRKTAAEKKIMVSAYVSPSTHSKMASAAKREGLSFSALAAKAIGEYLDALERQQSH